MNRRSLLAFMGLAPLGAFSAKALPAQTVETKGLSAISAALGNADVSHANFGPTNITANVIIADKLRAGVITARKIGAVTLDKNEAGTISSDRIAKSVPK